MLEFCFTHPDSIRMLFPGGDNVTIQSISGCQERKRGNEGKIRGKWRSEQGEKRHRDGQMVFSIQNSFQFSSSFWSSWPPPHPSLLSHAPFRCDTVVTQQLAAYTVSVQSTLFSLDLAERMRMWHGQASCRAVSLSQNVSRFWFVSRSIFTFGLWLIASLLSFS